MTKHYLYNVIMTGTGIFFENDTGRAITGFVTCRRVEADSEESAGRVARHTLLIHWNQSFNAERKMGIPRLKIEKITRVRRWLAGKLNSDYYFFDSEALHQAHLQSFEKT